MLRNNERRADDGFSLIELVVAVGILMIMSGVGLVAYVGVQKNARQAAVDASASSVLMGAVSYEADYDTDTTAEGARDEWMNTRGDDSISVVVEKLPGCLRVSAEHEKGETSIRESGDACDGAVLPPVEDDETGVVVPPEEEETDSPEIDGSENTMVQLMVMSDQQFAGDYRVVGVEVLSASGELVSQQDEPFWIKQLNERVGAEEGRRPADLFFLHHYKSSERNHNWTVVITHSGGQKTTLNVSPSASHQLPIPQYDYWYSIGSSSKPVMLVAGEVNSL